MVKPLKVDFSGAPHDPIKRLLWLSGARESFDQQVEVMWRNAYYEARRAGLFQTALDLGLHSRKRAIAFTRTANEERGRGLRWGDGF
jgi:hypothetical protein